MKNKKIYTITFHRANNYGALLQACALQKFLKNNNYDTTILDYDNLYISDHYRIVKKNKKNIIKLLLHFLIKVVNIRKELLRINAFDSFRNKLCISDQLSLKSINSNINNSNNIIISGSDQVWNPRITGGVDPIYLLEVFDKCKRISYAASCGSTSVLDGYENVFIDKVTKIDKISVREKELKDYLNKRIDNDIELVVDPTLLISKDDWLSIFDNNRIIDEKYIFVYSVDNDNDIFINTVNELSKLTGYKIVYFDRNDLKNRFHCKKENWYKAGPSEFLNLLYNSEYVVSTSFHALALSTVLNKEIFVTLSSKPDRLITLCNAAGLDHRIVDDLSRVDKLLNNKIDWNLVNSKIERLKDKSQKWLINSIEE